MVLRAHIVLRCGAGVGEPRHGPRTRRQPQDRHPVAKALRPVGLDGPAIVAPRSKPALSAEFVQCILSIQRFTRSAPGGTHWSTRTLGSTWASQDGHPARLESAGLQPHRLETFKLSRDKQFVDQLRDVVGLYLNPPEHALAHGDEKSQIQALDRSQPGLPLKKGRAGTMTHDFKRHGTTTLFAAFNVLDYGQVIGECLPRHRHQEFLKFLRKIDREDANGAGAASDRGQLLHA